MNRQHPSESHLKVASALREYLSSKLKEEHGKDESLDEKTMPLFCPEVPRQPNGNGTDCGLFLIQYIESFFKVRKTERQRDRETERQRDRETERQRDRETER
jgi:Ulp1 family protease